MPAAMLACDGDWITDNAWLDLAVLAPVLFPRHAAGAGTLDDWLSAFACGGRALQLVGLLLG